MENEKLALTLPCTIHGYNFHQLIGQGGYSQIFLVTRPGVSIQYVAKVSGYQKDLRHKAQIAYERELDMLSSLSNPYIIKLYDHFIEQDLSFLLLEYCPCGDLQQDLKSNGPYALDKFITISRQMIQAVQFCHQNKIAHHDIKPKNFLCPAPQRVQLADFGLAFRMAYPSLCKIFSGSIYYLAPEIVQKKPHDPFPADIWSLGISFIVLLTGQNIFGTKDSAKLKDAIVSGYLSYNGLPPDIRPLLRSMTSLDPANRPTINDIANSKFYSFSLPNRISVPKGATHDPLSPRGRQLYFSDRALGKAEVLSFSMSSSGSLMSDDQNPASGSASERMSSGNCTERKLTFSPTENTHSAQIGSSRLLIYSRNTDGKKSATFRFKTRIRSHVGSLPPPTFDDSMHLMK